MSRGFWRTASFAMEATISNTALVCARSAVRKLVLPTPTSSRCRRSTQAASAARAIARSGGDGKLQAWRGIGGHSLYQARDPQCAIDEATRIALLESVDKEARRLDPRVNQVIVSLASEFDQVLVAASDGTLCGDVRPLVRLDVSVVVEQKGRREQGHAGGGGRYDYGYFLEERARSVMRAKRCAKRW